MSYLAPVGSRKPGFAWGSYPSGGVHRALDFPVPTGTPVRAAEAGTIKLSGWSDYGFGYHIRMVLASNGHGIIYGHNSRLLVKAGQTVSRGQIIAYSGDTGRTTGPHVHMEMRRVLGDASTAYNFTSLLAYESYYTFIVSKLRLDYNNTEVMKYQKWLWSKQPSTYKTWFRANVRNWDTLGFTTLYGPATGRMTMDTYKRLNSQYPDGGWASSVTAKTPGPRMIRFYGGVAL